MRERLKMIISEKELIAVIRERLDWTKNLISADRDEPG